MKRWGVLLVFLLASSVSANSWLDLRTDYYVQARVKLGLTTGTSGFLSDTTASLLFNEAASVILPDNRGIKRITSFVTTYKESTYGLDTTLIDFEAVWWSKNDSLKPLKFLPVSRWFEQDHKTTMGQEKYSKRPSFYDYTDSQIVLFPVPSPPSGTADTIKIMGWHRLADVDTAVTPTVIPVKYRSAILYHIVWNCAKARGDARAPIFHQELNGVLGRIGLKISSGGQVEAVTP